MSRDDYLRFAGLSLPPSTGKVRKLSLRSREAALILQISAGEVLRLVRDGDLTNLAGKRQPRLDPEEVCVRAQQLVASGQLSPLALWVARLVLEGAVRVPSPASNAAQPGRLLDAVLEALEP